MRAGPALARRVSKKGGEGDERQDEEGLS
jgi:hypothetical protein